MKLFPWRKRKQEAADVARKLIFQERLAAEAERRVRRLEQEAELHRLRRRTR